MGAENNGSWKEQQARAALMAQTVPAGRRGIALGQVPCVKCKTTFTAIYFESTGRALLVGSGVRQTHNILYIRCLACNWGGTSEEAQKWLVGHPATAAVAKAPEEAQDAQNAPD